MRRKDREVTDRAELRLILDRCKTCYVAMVDEGVPYVVPLSYGYSLEEDTLTLYFHSAKVGRKLEILQKNNSVCFAISCEGELILPESPCEAGYYYSSVIGDGKVFFIEDHREKCMALATMFEHQSGRKVDFSAAQATSVTVYKIVSTSFSGKQKTV